MMVMMVPPTKSAVSMSMLVLVLTFVLQDTCALQQTTTLSQRQTTVKSYGAPRCTALRMDAMGENLDRRSFLAGITVSPCLIGSQALAADGDMMSQMFNPDGSLKDGVGSEAKESSVDILWNDSDQLQLNIDGANAAGTESGKTVKVSYRIPDKWGTGADLYLDRSEGANLKACNQIIVYQAPGRVSESRLSDATKVGVGKALDVVEQLSAVGSADIISGRKTAKGDQVYYEFDMAVAPKTCSESKANLGLGFCPYDTIYLLSATVIEGRLFVIGVESNYSEWKQANADLKRVRSSFGVSMMDTA